MENPNGILHFLMFVGTRKAGPGNAGVIKCPVDTLLSRGRVHWFQNTVEDCGLKPILFHYRAIPIRVSLFLISAELKSQPTQSIAENPVAKKHNPIYNVEKTQGGI